MCAFFCLQAAEYECLLTLLEVMEEYEDLWDAYLKVFLSKKLHLSSSAEGWSRQYLASLFHSFKHLPIKQRVLNVHAHAYVYQKGTALLSTLRNLDAIQKHTRSSMQQVDLLLNNFVQRPQALAESAIQCMYDAVVSITSKKAVSDHTSVVLTEIKRELREIAIAFYGLVSSYTSCM